MDVLIAALWLVGMLVLLGITVKLMTLFVDGFNEVTDRLVARCRRWWR